MRTDSEICQEARFVLWALRCAMAASRGDDTADAELARGFALADVCETAPAFAALTQALCAAEWTPLAWHHPRCGCVSAEEMCVLQALADTAERQRQDGAGRGLWWSLVLPARLEVMVDRAATEWLAALHRAGVVLPTPSELADCLQPLERLASHSSGMRTVHH